MIPVGPPGRVIRGFLLAKCSLFFSRPRLSAKMPDKPRRCMRSAMSFPPTHIHKADLLLGSRRSAGAVRHRARGALGVVTSVVAAVVLPRQSHLFESAEDVRRGGRMLEPMRSGLSLNGPVDSFCAMLDSGNLLEWRDLPQRYGPSSSAKNSSHDHSEGVWWPRIPLPTRIPMVRQISTR